jgi:YfiH family protein
MASFDQFTAAALDAATSPHLAGTVHGFMGRAGGVSRGAYATFNLARWIGDDAEAVAENWRRWRANYPGLATANVAQVHGATIHRVGRGWSDRRPEGDGMVSAESGVALGVFTADCAPILLADRTRRVIGALHAGWRGTIAGIAGAGVRAMVELGARPEAIRAAIGPAIDQCCFEVDLELAERFEREIAGAAAFARPGRPGKAYLDLRGINRMLLERAGLNPDAIDEVGPCTRCANDRYFSRRAAGGAVTGLQMSFIALSD